MSLHDDYLNEMTRLSEPSDDQVERLLTGRGSEGSDRGLVQALEDIKACRPSAPDARVAREHLAAMSAEATHLRAARPLVRDVVPVRPAWRRVMTRTTRIALQTAGAAALLSLSMIGLAFAGVDLPGTAAEDTLESVSGVELPNQTSLASEETTGAASENGKSVSDDVHAVIESATEKGCEFGQAVAEAASQNRRGSGGSDQDPCTKGDETTAADSTTAEDASTHEPQGSRATGQEHAAGGAAKSETASDDAGDDDDDTTAEDRGSQGAERSA